MGDFLRDIAEVLENAGVGTRGSNIFRGYMPDDPDLCLAVYEVPGMKPDGVMAASGGVVQKNYGLDVVTRAVPYEYDLARTMAQQAYDVLAGMAQQTLNATRYNDAWPRSEPYGIGRDKNGRVLISCKYDVMRDP